MLENNLKVLLISPLPPPEGGIATWTQQYIDWASKNNLKVDIVNTALKGTRAERFNDPRNLVDEIKRTKSIIKDLNSKIRTINPSVIHLNTSCEKFGIIRDYICLKIAKMNDKKVVVHYRCDIEDQVGKRIIQKYFLRKLCNISDENLVLNNNSQKYLFAEFNKSSIKIVNFIDEAFILKEPKITKDEVEIISFIGHIQRAKGIFEIIEVAKYFPEIIFKLAGPVGKEFRNIKVSSNIVFMGSITKCEIKELLMESDIFLFPSYSEGFANVMLEAMALGLPIITTPVGSNIDMLESTGGIIVEIGNSLTIVNAVNTLKNPKVRLGMSKWNIDKVKNKYTTKKIMSKLISIYLSAE